MKLYLDASILVAIFTEDVHTDRAVDLISGVAVVVSDFAAAEFASAISRLVRMSDLTEDVAGTVFSHFDRWRTGNVEALSTTSADVRRAETYLRRMIPGLRTPDALNLALAEGADLAVGTFDEGMARAARTLGIRFCGVD